MLLINSFLNFNFLLGWKKLSSIFLGGQTSSNNLVLCSNVTSLKILVKIYQKQTSFTDSVSDNGFIFISTNILFDAMSTFLKDFSTHRKDVEMTWKYLCYILNSIPAHLRHCFDVFPTIRKIGPLAFDHLYF